MVTVEDYGLENNLDTIQEYLKTALVTKNVKTKNENISKALGAVVATNQLITIKNGVKEDEKWY